MGYYPAAPAAITELLYHLAITRNEGSGSFYVLDPCAGEGAAIAQLAEGLNIPEANVYAIELDPGRGAKVKDRMPKANVLAPCSLDGALVGWSSFGLAYVNPPYDHKLGGGGREELEFARISYNLLCRDGILVLVMPFSVLAARDTLKFLDCYFKDGGIYRFPDAVRHYNEVVFIGRKRASVLTEDLVYKSGWLHNNVFLWNARPHSAVDLQVLGTCQRTWRDGKSEPSTGDENLVEAWAIPRCFKPHVWAKGSYLPGELLEAIGKSPLNRLVEGTTEPAIKQPPIPLSSGHVATLLAAGQLDGIVVTAHGNHVVRGVSYREKVLNEELGKYEVSEDGKTAKITEVISEYPATKVRALDSTGTIYDFTFAPAKKEEASISLKMTGTDG